MIQEIMFSNVRLISNVIIEIKEIFFKKKTNYKLETK